MTSLLSSFVCGKIMKFYKPCITTEITYMESLLCEFLKSGENIILSKLCTSHVHHIFMASIYHILCLVRFRDIANNISHTSYLNGLSFARVPLFWLDYVILKILYNIHHIYMASVLCEFSCV